MKKVYSKPEMEIEVFQAEQSVANINCDRGVRENQESGKKGFTCDVTYDDIVRYFAWNGCNIFSYTVQRTCGAQSPDTVVVFASSANCSSSYRMSNADQLKNITWSNRYNTNHSGSHQSSVSNTANDPDANYHFWNSY